MSTLTISSALAAWLTGYTGAKRVKDFRVLPDGSAPHWEYEAGFTQWKNGKPKKYTRVVSTVTVGRDWLIKAFPVAYVRARLFGNEHLAVTEDDVIAFEERARDRQLFLERTAPDRCRNESTCNELTRRKESDRSTDPEMEYAYEC